MNEQPKIVTWRAVSTEEQVEKESLDFQHQQNMLHVERWHGIVYEQLEIPGESRSIIRWDHACKLHHAFRRLDELLSMKPVPFNIFMCQDITRVARTASLAATFAALCEQAGVLIYETASPPGTIYGQVGTSDTRLLMLFKGHQSEQEIRKFAERSMFGRRARIKQGKHSGVPPYGYRRVFDGKGIAHTEIDEDEAAVVRLFYEMYLEQGYTLRMMCDEFNARGIFSPRSNKPWVPGNIRQFLRNCWTYAGYTDWGSYQSKRIPASEFFRAKAEWEPIISDDTARRVTQLLKQRSQAPRSVTNPHRLSMVAKCGYCGSTITRVISAGKGGCATNRYVCVNRCTGSRIGEPEMTADIRAFIVALQDEAYLESLIEETPDHYASVKNRLEEVSKSLDKVRAERKRLTLAFTRDTISIEEYEAIMAEMQVRQEGLAHTVAELEEVLASTPTSEIRRSRLEEIRDSGIEMLEHPDNFRSNRWLRAHIELVIAGYKVSDVQSF